ncbi:MAG: glycosyltransferase family 4 protein [Acidobacteriota bacterium]|nr:MAG: glycosyltransferase family 4 protein [Acidobacteriota bacterium]
MRILYFVQYFNLPNEPGGSRPYQFARHWVRTGHDVTVITGAVNHKTLTVPRRYRGRLIVREQVEGIRVLRVWSYAGIRGSFRKRLINFLTYAVTATLAGWVRGGKPDLIYASSTPLTVGVPGLLVSLIKRAAFVFEVRDLWPQSAVVAGVLRDKALATRLARGLARLLYRQAARVVAVTRGITEGLVDAGVAREKIVLVPNGVDHWMVPAGELPVAEPAERFRVVYCGAHGRWNGLGQILDAAALVLEREQIEFLFIGDGDERKALQERAAELGLERVRFIGALAKQEAFEQLRAGSAGVIVTWKHPFQRMVLANKLFDYMAAGRPVIVGAEGEMAEIVREAGCGIVVAPEDPPALADAIVRLAELPADERERLGRRARRFIIERYQRADLAWKLLDEFGALTGKSPGRSTGPQRAQPRLVSERDG